MEKALAPRKQVAEENANNDDCPLALNSSLIRLFDVPTLSLEANAYYELASFDSYQQQSQAIASLTDTEIEECCEETSGITISISLLICGAAHQTG